ncbi:MAG: c-type cytochrome [Gammaproteobacteria bacterium]|nr:c-type cytochrome [Gammaproteobacteria bacterium]MDE2251403.1 c-type cytochrome [Gammaproteobacteria bacterium]
MKTFITTVGAVAAMLLAQASPAADEITPEARLAAQHVAVMTCATCHGPQGRSVAPKFPALAGQHPKYLVAQLEAFKSQTRGDADAIGYMWGMASPLSDEMIAALAAYYAAQTPVAGSAGDAGAIARGADIYANGVAAEGIPPCIACHGPGASGTDDYPRLAGQHAQYLLKQLRSFQNNMRNVAVMHGVAQDLKANEMEAVAAYLQSLGSR